MDALMTVIKNIDKFNRISPERTHLRKFLCATGINSSWYIQALFSVSYNGIVRLALHSNETTENDEEIWETFDIYGKWDIDSRKIILNISYAGRSVGLRDDVEISPMSTDELLEMVNVIADIKKILNAE
jgi:hypothetical protein